MRRTFVALLLCTGVIAGLACATEEDVHFGDPARVAAGASGVTSTTTSSSSTAGGGGAGGNCEPDPTCAVSFATDVYADLLLVVGGCTTMGCHLPPAASGNLSFPADDASAAYDAIIDYVVTDESKPENSGDYIVPCNPDASRILCNLRAVDGPGTNPYGECAAIMPLGGGYTTEQLDKVAQWIQCGAPNN